MARDLDRPLRDSTSEKNKKTVGHIDGLLKTFSTKDAKALDYWLDNSWNSNWRKPVQKHKLNVSVAKDDIVLYNEKGFETITNFACFLGEEYYLLYNEHADILKYSKIFNEL